MPQCDGLECFCSSAGMNVSKFSSTSYAVLKMTLLYLSVNYLWGVTGLLASEIKFYQIMFHCIQGLLYIILYLCLKCRCILVLMVLMLMTPLINLLIKWMFWYIRKPSLGHYCIQYRVSNACWCITNTWIVYFCDEVCNVSYVWLRWIFLPSTIKVFPFLENGIISTFGCFPPWCQYDRFWWLRKFVCLMYSSSSEKPLASVVGIGGVSGFFSVVLNDCWWWWLVLLL